MKWKHPVFIGDVNIQFNVVTKHMTVSLFILLAYSMCWSEADVTPARDLHLQNSVFPPWIELPVNSTDRQLQFFYLFTRKLEN